MLRTGSGCVAEGARTPVDEACNLASSLPQVRRPKSFLPFSLKPAQGQFEPPMRLGLHKPILPTTIRPKTFVSVTFGDLNRITDFRRRRLTSFVGIKRYEGYLLRGCVMRDTCYEDGNTKFQSQWIHVSPIHVWWGEVNICMWIFSGDVWLWVVNQINDFVQERSKRSR